MLAIGLRAAITVAPAEHHGEVGQHAEMAPAMVALMVEIRMSRCFTWASSCAITPRSSRALSTRMMPVVAATAALLGVAAGGEGVGRVFVDQVDLGHREAGVGGEFTHHAYELRRGLSSTSRALYIFSTILSENQ
jgi:hypothetical protein